MTREAEFPIVLYRQSQFADARMYLVAFWPSTEIVTWSDKRDDALRCTQVDADRLKIVYGERARADLLEELVA